MPRPRRPPQGAVDPNPILAGCTLKRYARVCRALVRAAPRTPPERTAELARHGFDTPCWEAVDQAWSARIRSDDAVRRAFHIAYAGVGGPGLREIE
jgi:hypothetical protein